MHVCCCVIGCQNIHFSVAAERFSTSLQLPTQPILRQQCTVAIAVVLLINLLHHLTLYILILILTLDYDKYSYRVNRQQCLSFSWYDVIDSQNVNKSLSGHFQTLS